jgi:hypothetical protein
MASLDPQVRIDDETARPLITGWFGQLVGGETTQILKTKKNHNDKYE